MKLIKIRHHLIQRFNSLLSRDGMAGRAGIADGHWCPAGFHLYLQSVSSAILILEVLNGSNASVNTNGDL